MTGTDTAARPASASPPPPPGPAWWRKRLLWPLRNLWRSLTSMRTALALLFLLALAAIPGALLPQRDLNGSKTAEYIAERGALGEWMDRFQLFEVFSSAWFTAIYVLLFVSLVGCLTPRMIEHFHALRAQPVAAPRNLKRLPRHLTVTVDGEPEQVAEQISGNLRGWRRSTTVREPDKRLPDGAVEVSAEKGYLREFGNLVFHFALLALLVAIAVGKLWGYEGTRILVADGEQGLCNTSTAVYDSFRSGAMVDGTDLSPFCIRIDDFDASFLESGQPDNYDATVTYTSWPGAPADEWETTSVQVNHPLRLAGDRVYVLGNGFAPIFTVSFPNGETRTQTEIFIPQAMETMLSEGAARFDPPAGMFPDEDERRRNQIGIEGLFAPSAVYEGTLLDSAWPVPDNPAVGVRIYQGDTGIDSGLSQNAYSLDSDLIHTGRLEIATQGNLAIGESRTLDDGTVVSFDGFQRWVSVQVSHDPAQNWVLGSSIVMMAGLLVSILVRRRRVWARLVPVTDAETGQRRTVVEIAGLARTDQAGWGEGFEDQARELVGLEPETETRHRGL